MTKHQWNVEEKIDELLQRGDLAGALAMIRQHVETEGHPALSRWRQGQLELRLGDDVGAWRSIKTAHRLRPTALTRYGLLALLVSRGRLSWAEKIAGELAAETSLEPRTAIVLARLFLARGDACSAAAVLTKASKSNDMVSRLLEAAGLAQRLRHHGECRGMRHITIGGVSHIGSTVLGLILGSAPGFTFAGETQHLFETNLKWFGGKGKIPLGRDVARELWPMACRICGDECEVFDEDFRLNLVDRDDRYLEVAKRLGARHLVTTEKNLAIFQHMDPLFRFDLVVSYKSPEQQIRSEIKHRVLKHGQSIDEFVREVPILMSTWARNYAEQLFQIRCSGRKIFLNWEELVADPAHHLYRLSQLLDIQVSEHTLHNIRVNHFVGGANLDVLAIRQERSIGLRPSNAPPLPPRIAALVAQHKRAQHVHALLERRYVAQFGASSNTSGVSSPRLRKHGAGHLRLFGTATRLADLPDLSRLRCPVCAVRIAQGLRIGNNSVGQRPRLRPMAKPMRIARSSGG